MHARCNYPPCIQRCNEECLLSKTPKRVLGSFFDRLFSIRGTREERKKKKKKKAAVWEREGTRGGAGRDQNAEEGRQGPEGPGLTTALVLGTARRICQFRCFFLLLSRSLLFCNSGGAAVLPLGEHVSHRSCRTRPPRHGASLARTLRGRTAPSVLRTDPAVQLGGLTCCGLRRGILPHAERQALSCLQWGAAAGRPAFHFFFSTFLRPLQLQPQQRLPAAGQRPACPFVLPRREEREARQRARASFPCRRRFVTGRKQGARRRLPPVPHCRYRRTARAGQRQPRALAASELQYRTLAARWQRRALGTRRQRAWAAAQLQYRSLFNRWRKRALAKRAATAHARLRAAVPRFGS